MFFKGYDGKNRLCYGWVDMVMKCVLTISYSITINEKMEDFFRLTRGLRQGDPLSPFLFLILVRVYLLLCTLR